MAREARLAKKDSPEKRFGDVVRKLRHERGLSQEEVAFRSGYHRTYVSLLERGLNSPSLAAIFKLAEALDIRPSELVRAAEELEGRHKH